MANDRFIEDDTHYGNCRDDIQKKLDSDMVSDGRFEDVDQRRETSVLNLDIMTKLCKGNNSI